MYKYTLIYILIYSYIWSNEQHRCSYCGKRAYKYCVTCCDAGAWAVDTYVAVCGRRSGRVGQGLDHHAAGGAVKHGSWKLIRKKDATKAATPNALDFDWFCSVVRVHVKCMFANMHIAC